MRSELQTGVGSRKTHDIRLMRSPRKLTEDVYAYGDNEETKSSPPPRPQDGYNSRKFFVDEEMIALGRRSAATKMPSRKVVPYHRDSSKALVRHCSAPVSRKGVQSIQERLPQEKSKNACQNKITVRRKMSPDYAIPTTIAAERQLKAPIKSSTPDYSALGRIPSVLLESSFGNLDLELEASLGYNNLNKTSSVDSATQNNGTVQEEDIPDSPLIKFGRQISAGVSSERRPIKVASKSTGPSPTFTDETKRTNIARMGYHTSSKTTETPSPTTLHSRSREKRELPRAVVEGNSEFQTEIFQEPNDLLEEGHPELKEIQTRLSSRQGDEDHLVRAASRYFGIPFRRKKSKHGIEIDCGRSDDECTTATSITKKERALPKMVRRLGLALSKKSVNHEDSRAVLLKDTINDVLSLQAIAVSGKKSSGRSVSSDDVSDAGSIDIDEIKVANPELYTSIIQTVASWCEAPTFEPDEDDGDALSIRTFSSISFRERGRRESQDLSHFELGTALAVEEAFLSDVIAGRIDNASDTSETCSHVSLDCETQEVTTPITIPSTTPFSKSRPTVSPLPPSFLYLTDSESDDDDLTKQEENDFLHLTSSEMETMDMNSMKEVLKMQGVWLFDWARCDSIKKLPGRWSTSLCLKKYLDGADGIEIIVEGRMVKCLLYPSSQSRNRMRDEHVYLDDHPPVGSSNVFNIKGTLTSMGLRTQYTMTLVKFTMASVVDVCFLEIEVKEKSSSGSKVEDSASRSFRNLPPVNAMFLGCISVDLQLCLANLRTSFAAELFTLARLSS